VAIVVATAVGSVVTGDLLWGVFSGTVAVIVALPAVASGEPRAMAPWEIVLLAALPVVGRTFASFQLSSDIATYLSIAALALLVAVNLHLFTTVEMNFGFAVLFVVVTTLAAAGVWAVVRWGADVYLGTGLLFVEGYTEAEIEHGLMVEFVGSAVAGLLAGLLFELYVRRRRVSERVPEGVA